MSKKQSRVVRSSSLGDIGLFNNVRAIEPPAAVSRPKPKQWKAPRRSILTVGSPPRESDEDVDIDKGFGVFIRSCFYCRKELSPSKDVFMAGYLRAFCSEKCRTTHVDTEEGQDSSSQPTQAI